MTLTKHWGEGGQRGEEGEEWWEGQKARRRVTVLSGPRGRLQGKAAVPRAPSRFQIEASLGDGGGGTAPAEGKPVRRPGGERILGTFRTSNPGAWPERRQGTASGRKRSQGR